MNGTMKVAVMTDIGKNGFCGTGYSPPQRLMKCW